MIDLKQQKAEAAAQFERVGFPTKKEELWCFTNVAPVAQANFVSVQKSSDLPYKSISAHSVVFENGRFSAEKSDLTQLPAGVRVGSIADNLDARIGTLATTQSAFVLSNMADFEDGFFVEIDEGVELEEPLHIIYLADAEGAVFHLRNLISAAANSKVSIFEEYIGAADAVYWTNGVTEAFVKESAEVEVYKMQRESEKAFHFQTVESVIDGNARFSHHAVTVGGSLGRNDIRSVLQGEGGDAVCNGLYLLNEKQHFDTHLFMDHLVPRCTSHQLYKGILDDRAIAVFCGRILVERDAQETDATQSNQSLILNRGARVHSLPQLEIFADDVKCAHGSTIGELDDNALFYMQARGIDPVEGKALLTYAFVNEVIEEMLNQTIKAYLQEEVGGLVQRVLK